ncbi:hypothetical protein [Myxosarcina sp. GI1(2024)]
MEAARSTLALALATAGLIEDASYKVMALIEIAYAQAQVENLDAAASTITLALQTALIIDSHLSKADVLEVVITAQPGSENLIPLFAMFG